MTPVEVSTLLDGKYVLEDAVGNGAFSHVYRAHSVTSPTTLSAIKCLKNSSHGIRSIIEPFIMSSIRHPNLMQATDIIFNKEYTCICMDLAVEDIYRARRRHLDKNFPLILSWCWQVCQALACLHQHDIVHGDIKSLNVLVMADQSLRLSDFTLSVVLPSSLQGHHTVCTITHRPPEVVLNLPWTRAVDVWALGCTLYEIVYGQLLFQAQSDQLPVEEHTLTSKVLACYREWGYLRQQDIYSIFPTAQSVLSRKRFKFQAPNLQFIHDPPYNLLNDLIFSMLHLDPNQRPTLSTVLAHPVFRYRQKLSSYFIQRPESVCLNVVPFSSTSDQHLLSVVQKLPKPLQHCIQSIWSIIYTPTWDTTQATQYRWGCTLITIKLFHHITTISNNTIMHDLLGMEQWIGSTLHWRLPI
jgi:serine/threonine protein kinase